MTLQVKITLSVCGVKRINIDLVRCLEIKPILLLFHRLFKKHRGYINACISDPDSKLNFFPSESLDFSA